MIPHKENKVNAYILAGGKSSRMGTDKGLLPFNGKPIIQHVIDQLLPVVNNVIIVSNNSEYEQFGLEVIADDIKNIGPAGGIYTALKHTDTEYNFIVSCDMPFVNSAAVNYLIQHSFQSQITLPLLHGRIEPLFGMYSKNCLAKWQELIESGTIKLRAMIGHFNLLELDVNANELFNDSLFVNINNKNDLEEALKKI